MGSVEHVVDVHVASLRAAVADRRGAREIPDPGLEAEVPLGERSHRADVHDIARVGIVELLTRIEPQLGPVPAVEDAELAGLGDLVREAHAARAQDAALLIQHHVRADRHRLLLLDLLLPEPRSRRARSSCRSSEGRIRRIGRRPGSRADGWPGGTPAPPAGRPRPWRSWCAPPSLRSRACCRRSGAWGSSPPPRGRCGSFRRWKARGGSSSAGRRSRASPQPG